MGWDGRKSFRRNTYHVRWQPSSSSAAIQPLGLAFWMPAESTGRTLSSVVGERTDDRVNDKGQFHFFKVVVSMHARYDTVLHHSVWLHHPHPPPVCRASVSVDSGVGNIGARNLNPKECRESEKKIERGKGKRCKITSLGKLGGCSKGIRRTRTTFGGSRPLLRRFNLWNSPFGCPQSPLDERFQLWLGNERTREKIKWQDDPLF